VDQSHNASASKDRTRVFVDFLEKITPKTGKLLISWLESGKEPEKTTAPAEPEKNKSASPALAKFRDGVSRCKDADGIKKLSDWSARNLKGQDLIEGLNLLTEQQIKIKQAAQDEDLPFDIPPQEEP
jgi:hypothetical protein